MDDMDLLMIDVPPQLLHREGHILRYFPGLRRQSSAVIVRQSGDKSLHVAMVVVALGVVTVTGGILVVVTGNGVQHLHRAGQYC